MKKTNGVSFDLMSDIHLEFIADDEEFDYKLFFPATKSKYLLVAGDICVDICGHGIDIYKKFFDIASKYYSRVICVCGNHDYYSSSRSVQNGHNFYNIATCAKDLYSNDKVLFLDNSNICLDGVYIVGGTCWSEVSPQNHMHVQKRMNDYFNIFKNDKGDKISVRETNEKNKECFGYIKKFVESHENDKVVVLTHHCPSYTSSDKKKFRDIAATSAYCNNYDNFIAYHPQIKVWCHGHTHDPYDYMIGETRILCNPCGYIYDAFDPMNMYGERPYDGEELKGWNLKTFVV